MYRTFERRGAGGGYTISRRMMEIVTEWTARRTYPQFLEGLGGKARHQAAIKARGYGYESSIRNFDRLREALGIADDGEMLACFEEVIRTEDRKKYQSAITDFFFKKAKKKVPKKPLNLLLSFIREPEEDFALLVRNVLGVG